MASERARAGLLSPGWHFRGMGADPKNFPVVSFPATMKFWGKI
jgi:hypothetical protein